MRSAGPEPDQALEHAELLEAIEALPQDFREALVAVDIVGLYLSRGGSGVRHP